MVGALADQSTLSMFPVQALTFRGIFPCSAVLFPMAVTVYITWWFLTFFDNFFSVSSLLD